jgi:hypothetical protein
MQLIDLKSEGHIIAARWDGTVDYFKVFKFLTYHGRWRCLVPAGGVLETIVCFCKSSSFDSTSDDAAKWIVKCEIKKKTDWHLPKDSAAVGYQRHALLKVRDGSQ